jgi:hypothetical protein
MRRSSSAASAAWALLPMLLLGALGAAALVAAVSALRLAEPQLAKTMIEEMSPCWRPLSSWLVSLKEKSSAAAPASAASNFSSSCKSAWTLLTRGTELCVHGCAGCI